jgi:hypothetical protein
VENFRRSQRYRFQLEVQFRGAFKAMKSLTEDVSFHGVFIRTDEVRTANQLIKFAVVDPADGGLVELLGIVARCVTPADAAPGKPPGVGVSLFGNDRATEARWVSLIRRVKGWAEHGLSRAPAGGLELQDAARRPVPARTEARPTPARPMEERPAPVEQRPATAVERPAAARPASAIELPAASAEPRPAPPTPPMEARPAPPAAQRPAAERRPPAIPAPPVEERPAPVEHRPAPVEHRPAPPPPPEPVRRAHVRRPARFNVTLRPAGVDELTHFELKDISEGGTFVLTPTLVPVGSEVNLRLIHPTSGETFHIAGQVVRTIDSLDPAEKGLGIRFLPEAVDREAWQAFLRRNAPVPPTGVELFPPAPNADRGHVRVLRTPAPVEPPVLLGPSETTAPGTQADEDPGGAPILLDESEQALPIILGPGVAGPEDDQAPPSRGPTRTDR